MRLVSTGSDCNIFIQLIGAHTTQHGSITWVIRLKRLMSFTQLKNCYE